MHLIGGAERLITDLALGFANEESTLEIVTGICHDRWRNELLKNNCVSLRELGKAASGNLEFWLNVKGFAKSLAGLISPETDLIFASSYPSTLAASLFPKRNNVRVIHYLQEAPIVLHEKEGLDVLPWRIRNAYRMASWRYAKLDVAAVRKCDLLIANSLLSRKINAEVYRTSESDIEVIYPGVHTEFFAPSSIVPQVVNKYVKEEKPIIFIPKGTQFWRNPAVCLQALRNLRKIDFVAVFTGGADYEVAALISRAKNLGLVNKVLWVQELLDEEINALYSRSSLVISIPKRQSFGMMPLEALLCGTPAVISSSSGVSEVLRDGEETMIVHDDSPEELADALEVLLSDVETRSRIVFNGKRKVLEKFASNRFVSEMKEKLESCL